MFMCEKYFRKTNRYSVRVHTFLAVHRNSWLQRSTRYLVIFIAFNTVIRYLFGCLSCVPMLMYITAFNNRRVVPTWRFCDVELVLDKFPKSTLARIVQSFRKIHFDDWRREGEGRWVKRLFCVCPLNPSIPGANGTTAVYTYLSLKLVQTRRF